MVPQRIAAVLIAGLVLTTGARSPVRAASASGTDTGGSTATLARTPTAGDALAGLARKGRAPMTGYSRARFGQAWTDAVGTYGGHNGCDTRNDVLRRDLGSVRLRAGGCVVTAGVLDDPYTGHRIAFHRGAGSSSVQIDHVVALGDAWQKGAARWSAAKRTRFANDPLNLLAVDGPTNQRKGKGDAATWLPRAGYRCAYVARQIAVKRHYGLAVTTAEAAAMIRVLATCPGRGLPTSAGTAVPAVGRVTHGTIRSTPVAPRHSSPGPTTVYYRNCAAVRAAGKAPLHRGRPGYRPQLDRDGDGVACE